MAARIGNQILGRAESVLLPVLWKLDIARGLVFYVPLIRSLVDFGKVFQFDVLRKRFFLDRVLSSLVVRRASVLGVVYFGIVLLLFWGSSRMVFDSAVDAEEVWVFLGALFFGVFNFNLVHRLWRSVRKKKKGSGTWIRCRFIRCPESTEFKAFLDHHRELYGLFSVSSLGRNGLLLNCRDAKVSREKIERRAPGLVISWETLGAPEAHSPERAQEWKQFKAKLDEVAIPRSEAREVLDREARSVRQMLEQGDNGRKSSDRQWRLFYDPAILRGSSIWIVPNSLWKVTPDRIRLGELARTTAYEFRLKGAFNGE